MTRARSMVWMGCALALALPASPARSEPETETTARDGQRDFDFELGRWKTVLKRRLNPLTGSDKWVDYEGITVVTPLMDGRANIAELAVSGPAGRIDGVSLRLYDPQTRQWSLNYASAAGGAMTPPVLGGFQNGRGIFYADDTLDGRPIRVRFVISGVTADSAHFEQAFSADGGKSWEVNWIADDTRIAGTGLSRRVAARLRPGA